MKIKEQIVLLLIVSISFCLVSFVFEVIVESHSIVTEEIGVWLWFFSGVCVSMGFISFGFMLRCLPDEWVIKWFEKELSFIGFSRENVIYFSNKTGGWIVIALGMFALFLSFRELFIKLGYFT